MPRLGPAKRTYSIDDYDSQAFYPRIIRAVTLYMRYIRYALILTFVIQPTMIETDDSFEY